MLLAFVAALFFSAPQPARPMTVSVQLPNGCPAKSTEPCATTFVQTNKPGSRPLVCQANNAAISSHPAEGISTLLVTQTVFLDTQTGRWGLGIFWWNLTGQVLRPGSALANYACL